MRLLIFVTALFLAGCAPQRLAMLSTGAGEYLQFKGPGVNWILYQMRLQSMDVCAATASSIMADDPSARGNVLCSTKSASPELKHRATLRFLEDALVLEIEFRFDSTCTELVNGLVAEKKAEIVSNCQQK